MPTQHTSPEQASATQQKPSTFQEAKQVAQELRHDLEEQVSRGRHKAMEQGQEFAQHQKERAAEEVHVFGSAIRSAAETLQEENHGQIAGYIEACADELDSISSYLRERRFEELYHDANRFARRHPEIFLGGMFLAGIAVTRFLKASQPEMEDDLEDESLPGGQANYDLSGDDLSYVGGVPAFGDGAVPAEPPASPIGPPPADLPGSGMPGSELPSSADEGIKPPGMDDSTMPEVPPQSEANPARNKEYDL